MCSASYSGMSAHFNINKSKHINIIGHHPSITQSSFMNFLLPCPFSRDHSPCCSFASCLRFISFMMAYKSMENQELMPKREYMKRRNYRLSNTYSDIQEQNCFYFYPSLDQSNWPCAWCPMPEHQHILM